MRDWFAHKKISYLYKNDQRGIMNRFFRETNAWDSHLNKTKAFIISHTKDRHFNKIAVLGSGWFLDVPVDSLLVSTSEIHVFDIVHPPQITNKFKASTNLKFFTQDLSFGLINQAVACKSVRSFIQNCHTAVPDIDFNAYDLVISLNLLNQLDILLLEYLQKRFPISLDEQREIRKLIQDNHIKMLPKGKSLLVSDWFEINWLTKDEKDSVAPKPLIYTNLLNNDSFESWIWDFDNSKTYRKKINTSFMVRAYFI